MSVPRAAVTVVGIGADGWSGLSSVARDRIRTAAVVMGSSRQLALVSDEGGQERVVWPSPLLAALPGLLERHRDRPLCVLASGDPLLHGIATTIIRLIGTDAVEVVPHLSSVTLACARLGWATDDVDVVSAVGRSIDQLHRVLYPRRRIIVLSADGRTPAAVARLLSAKGFGDTTLSVMEQLGGPGERILETRADDWAYDEVDGLNVIALDCRTPAPSGHSGLAGLPDSAYDHDGQLTKREVRAVTLARLAPVPGELLWDVGAGAGSIAIEWMRSHRSCRAVAIESDPLRATRIVANAAALGVPGLRVVTGAAPAALAGLDQPDAVFVGGGVTVPGMLEKCWDALPYEGRLVVNAVTLESEALVMNWYTRTGGDLTRISVNHAAPLGGFTGWRPTLPVTQWTVVKA